jgi:hypothetical protein
VDRFTAAIVAGVLVLVVVGVAVAVLLRGQEVKPDLGTPGGVAMAYELALQRGDAEQAWDLLATSAKANASREEFLLRAGGRRSVEDRSRLSIDAEEVTGETARVELTRTYPGSGGPFGLGGSYSQRMTVRLVREGGSWRITVPSEPYLLTSRP